MPEGKLGRPARPAIKQNSDAFANSHNFLLLPFDPPDGHVKMRVLGGLPVVGVQSLRLNRMARDVMLGLPKTCRKLRLSFFAYLGDRLGLNGDQPRIPPLADLVTQA